MTINKSYKVEIAPNKTQKVLLNKHFGGVRFVYNWGLSERIKYYEENQKSISYVQQSAIITQLKKEEETKWLTELSCVAIQQSLRNLEASFYNFFRGLKKGYNVGYPLFKNKNKSPKSFRLQKGAFDVRGKRLFLSKIGHVKIKNKDYIPTENVKYNNVTVSMKAGRYYASVSCEIQIPDVVEQKETVLGVDLGIKTLLVCSDGSSFENPKNTKKYEKKLSRAQRKLAKKKQGSKNREKAKLVVQKIYKKITDCRLDLIHKATTILAKTKPRYIALEDLNIAGMMKNHKLAKSIQDASFGEIKRQLNYKSAWYGSEVILVDRWFPSSKLCHSCGVIKEALTLADRTFNCSCGYSEDRDLNAAINLEQYAINTLRHRGIYACGESCLEETSLKQELFIKKVNVECFFD